ncbi:MAG: hypothetical protein IIB54_12890, partial [Planctomycetes bacterium]|nr:hypothetical protein [Planctomycetota bacterium]
PIVEAGDPNSSSILPDDFDLDGNGDITEPTPDLDLFLRVFDGDDNGTARVDMGAYESFPSCCEDIAGLDHVINGTDLDALLAAWGACPDPCVSCTINDPDTCIADINRDCVVNVTDLLALLAAWGPCVSNGCDPCP